MVASQVGAPQVSLWFWIVLSCTRKPASVWTTPLQPTWRRGTREGPKFLQYFVSHKAHEAIRKSVLHDALAGHGIGLLVNALDVPEALLLVLIVRAQDNGDDVELEPKTGAQSLAHVLEGHGQTGANELGKVGMLIVFKSIDDIVGNGIVAGLGAIVKVDMLDCEVQKVDSVMDRKGNHSSVGVGENGRDTAVKGL